MANNKKDSCHISYTIKLGSSTYYLLNRSTKNSNYYCPYAATEQTTRARSKSAKPLPKSPITIPRSQSLKQFPAVDRRSRGTTVNNNDLTRISQRRYAPSKSRNTKQITDKMIRNKREIIEEKSTSPIISIEQKEKELIKDMINNENPERIRLLDEQRRSLTQLIEQIIGKMTFPSIETIKQLAIETLRTQQEIFTQELKHSIQQELAKISQDCLTETTEKYLTSLINNNNSVLHHLFAAQNQALVNALIQQPAISSIDLIKRALLDVLTESNPPSVTTYTTSNLTKSRQSSTEILITANINQTRTDAALRQQRDTIVANRYLRESIQQWPPIHSIASLIENIQEYCTNDMEHAWLLYYWIGQNIRYDRNCHENSVEYVFENRIGSSQGFVNFYSECCSLLNIPCFQIAGYTRQNDIFEHSLHIWNGIILDQHTYLIDSAWGAGSSNEFQDCYFLTSPEEFIYTHFSQDYQLLQPTITKDEFLRLPLMKSNYYRLNLNLLSPKQAINQITENLFRISLRTPAYVDLVASLQINRIEYPSLLHTLCQRDPFQSDIINCYFAPPSNGPYEIFIYAKTHDEMKYQETIYMRLNVTNLYQMITFPLRSHLFFKYQCILIEPFRRLVEVNERILISMKIPDAQMIKILNGDQLILPTTDEYQNNFLKKEIFVRGDIRICVRWNEKPRKLSTICMFHMM